MAYLDQPININELPEETGGGDYTPIPAGEYNATIKSADVKATSKGDGQYIKLRLDITGPTHSGRVIFANVNIRNASQQAEQIGRAQLRSIMGAIGLADLTDTDQLIGGQLVVKVAVKDARVDPATGKTYEASNEVKAYKAMEGGFVTHAVGEKAPSPFGGASTSAQAKTVPPWAKK